MRSARVEGGDGEGGEERERRVVGGRKEDQNLGAGGKGGADFEALCSFLLRFCLQG